MTKSKAYFTYDNKVLTLQDSPTTLTGVYDLPLWGTERFNVESRYQTLTNGQPVDLTCVEGTFVMGPDGTLFQLQWVDETDNHHPAGSLPEDAALVVRTDALRALRNRSRANKDRPPSPYKEKENTSDDHRRALRYGEDQARRLRRSQANRQRNGATGGSVSADKISLAFVEIDEAVEARKKN